MRKYLRVSQTKIYRKYLIDPHNFLLKRAKITKALKFILIKTIKILKKKYLYKKKFKNFIKKNLYVHKKKKKNIKKSLILSWKAGFWSHFKTYFVKKKLKKKFLKTKFFRKIRKIKKIRFFLKNKISYQASPLSIYNRKRITIKGAVINFKRKRNQYKNKYAWLVAYHIGRRRKKWWLLRETYKKTAFYYGFTNLKKFRFINELNKKKMALPMYNCIKLESMLNILLLRLNIWDSLIHVNNLIKRTSIITVNGVVCNYPNKALKLNDSIIVNKFYFKKIFYIFLKRSKFNKTFIIKNMIKKKHKGLKKKRVIRNVINVPNYIEYNYKIMYFTFWRLPKLHEIKSYGFGYNNYNIFDWALDTRLKYNN